MQTIKTKYVGATNTRGARITATASGNHSTVSISNSMYTNDLNPHIDAVRALAAKLNWSGKMIGSDTRDGMVWVFDEDLNPHITL